MKSTWTKVRLGELGEFRNGVNFSRELAGRGLGLINVKDIFTDNPKIDFGKLDKVNLADKVGIGKYYVKSGDLFFVRSSVKREGVGYVAYSPVDSNNVIHCGFVIRFRLTSQDVSPLYLVYLLRTPFYREKIINISSGAAITNISQASLSNLEIELPPQDIQSKIANLLFCFDDLIEVNSRRTRILEEIAQSVYHEWFVRLNCPGHENAEITQTRHGPELKGWTRKKVEDISIFRKGKKPKGLYEEERKGTVPYLLIDGLRRGRFTYTDDLSVVAQKDDTIMVMDGASSGDVYIGHEGSVGSTLGYYRSLDKEKVSPYLIYYFFKANHKLIVRNNVGSAIPHANKDFINQMELLVPSQDVHRKFDSLMENMHKETSLLKEKNIQLARMRDLLLPRLASGEIHATELDVDGV